MVRGIDGIERCRLLDVEMRGLKKGSFLGMWIRRCRLGLVVFTCDGTNPCMMLYVSSDHVSAVGTYPDRTAA